MINILVTLNENYLSPLKTMLNSLFINNPNEKFTIYLLHSSIPKNEINKLQLFIKNKQQHFKELTIDKDSFKDAPVFRHYTTEMYYRLAAHQFLPPTVDKVLYLDPDILVLNPVRSFYETDFGDNLFVAAEHEVTTKLIQPINRLRLKAPLAIGYFNTGVMLMNVKLMRKYVNLQEIYAFIEENKYFLVLPDQDVLNALYWDKIKKVNSFLYNYDARFYERTKFLPNSKYSNWNWIEKNTVFLHFCGKDKPWNKDYKGELRELYKQYIPDLDEMEDSFLA